MIYSKGKAGPVSRMTIEVGDVDITEDGANSRCGGDGIAEMARGKVKGVSFRVQGRKFEAARPWLVRGAKLDVDVRWTGGSAVTIVTVHGGEPANDDVVRKPSYTEQVQALFG